MNWLQSMLSWIVPGLVGALLMLGIPALVRWIKSENVVDAKLMGIAAKIDTLEKLFVARLEQIEADVRHESARNDEQDHRHISTEVILGRVEAKLDILIQALKSHGVGV